MYWYWILGIFIWASRGWVLIDRRAIIILYLASLPKLNQPSLRHSSDDPDERENTKDKDKDKDKYKYKDKDKDKSILIVKQILVLKSYKHTFLSSYSVGFISNQPFCDLFLKMKPGHIRGIAFFVLHRNHCVYSFWEIETNKGKYLNWLWLMRGPMQDNLPKVH